MVFVPAEEETVTVDQLADGDKILWDDDEWFVRGTPHRDSIDPFAIVLPLADASDPDQLATPYAINHATPVVRVLVDRPIG